MTDYTYAVLNSDGRVTNIVASDNPEAVTPLRLLIPEAKDIILATEETGPAYIGGDILKGRFRMAKPFPSWTWDEGSWAWTAPVPYPEGRNVHVWDESTLSWVEVSVSNSDGPTNLTA